MHFDDGFPNKSCSKERPEGDQEMTTSDSSQVKERIWDLQHIQQKLFEFTGIVYCEALLTERL